MLVSGGKVIAIDSIKKGNTNKDTLSGDGVWTNLGVNTNVIATTKKLNDTKSELESKINSASSALSGEIKKKQDELKFDVNKYGKITAIGTATGTTTALAGGSNVVVSAGANTRVDSAISGEQTIYTVNVTANPTNVTVSGENGLTARRDEGSSAYYLGLNNNYINAITSVSSKLPITAFTSYSAAHKNDDVTPYTAGNYIEITNHKIIGHDWTNTIKSASSNAVNTVRNTFNGNGTSYSGYDGKPFIDNTTPKWSVVGDGNRISVTSANNKYQVSWDSAGYATEEWVFGKNYLPKDVASSTYLTIASANEIYQKKLHAGAGIVIKNETEISVDISVSGDIIPYSAGEGIGIDNHIVSITADYLSANALKDLSGRWQSASNALEASADNWNKTYKDVSDSAKYWNSAYDALASADKWNTTYERVELSGDEWDKVTDKLDSATFKTYSALMEQKLIDLDDKNLDVSSFSSVSSDFALKEEVQKEFEQTSAWVKDNFLSANALDEIKSTSSNWNNTYSAVTANSSYWDSAYSAIKLSSENWNLTYDRVKTSAEIWDTVVDKLNTDDFTAWSAKTTDWDISAYSGVYPISVEQHKVSIDLSEYYKKTETSGTNELDTKFDEIENRIEPIENDVATLKESSAHNVVESSNEYIEVQSGTNKFTLTFTSGDLATKSWVGEQLADFGGFVLSTATGDDHHPDVENPSNKKVYLIEDTSSPNPDRYYNWIVTGDATTGWLCIGDTTMDLSDYYRKNETSSRNEISTEFTNTSAWANATFQPIGDYVVSSTDVIKPGSAWVLVNDNDNIQWSGLDVSELGKKYIVKSTNGTIGVGSATVGNVVTYDLSGATIVGENGISAEFNTVTNEWNVGLEKTNLIAFGKFHSNINTYTTSAALTGFVQEDIVGDDIYLEDGKVYVNSGLYHIDIQVEVTVPGTNNEYYNTILKSTISPTRQIQQEIDGSYAHTETIDLSFDNRYAENGTELEFTIENLPTNASIYVKNLNIHRIICSLTEIDGGSQYQAGDAIKIENNTINLDYGDGLELSGNKIQVKLGEGLKFDENAGVKAITINSEVEDVVNTVTAIASDLDTKISNNFPPAMITVADADIAQYRNNGALYGTLFNVSINQAVEIDRSLIGMYIYRVDNNMNVVFGLYEYQPDYPRYNDDNPEHGISAYGRTVPLCDTGVVQLTTATKGFCEWPIKHLNNTIGTDNPETRPSLKSSCMYYATIYMGSDLQSGGLHIGSFSGYAPQFNDIKPGLTIANDNINCSLGADYSSAVSFNDFGFSWKYNNYANYYAGTDKTYSTGNYSEKNDGYRFYMQIRNKAKEA